MMRSRILLVLGILLIILGLGIAYLPKSEQGEGIPPVTEDTHTHTDWKTYTDGTLSFRYPESLGLTYVHAQEWPPKITVGEAPAECAGQIEVNSHTYCRTVTTEGAAGSIYADYTYRSSEGLTLAFTTRTPQCANYDEPQKATCEQEQASFNPEELADHILQTVERN